MTVSTQRNEIPRFEIDELALQYELEPSMFDIFVEGDCDVGVVANFLAAERISGVAIYDVDLVNVPAVLSGAIQHASGNGARVVALAVELERLVPTVAKQVICIADSDFQDVLGTKPASSCLLWTDYASMESYLLEAHTLSAFFSHAMTGAVKDTRELYNDLVDILQRVACFRIAAAELPNKLTWICFLNSCKLQQERILFEPAEFLARLLKSNSRWADRNQFQKRLDELEAVVVNDVRSKIRGHDLLDLLAWYIRERRPRKKFWIPEAIRVALWGYAIAGDVYNAPLFCEIRRRLVR